MIINMNPKNAILILILLALTLPSSGIEPLYLGRGLSDQVINLDAGAGFSGHSYNFAATGFVAPRMPQPMALSPNIMVTQARKLMDEAKAARDESVSARDEAEAIYNETQALLAEIDKKEQNIHLLQEKTELESKATAANAAQARIFMNKTEEVYNKTQALSIEIENNLRKIKDTLQEARDYANTSAGDASVIDATQASCNMSR
ncbi:MAG TPA: hypothetical protein VF300_03160 [Methanothrix sp.]